MAVLQGYICATVLGPSQKTEVKCLPVLNSVSSHPASRWRIATRVKAVDQT